MQATTSYDMWDLHTCTVRLNAIGTTVRLNAIGTTVRSVAFSLKAACRWCIYDCGVHAGEVSHSLEICPVRPNM